MSFINKKKFIKLKEEINKLKFNGEEILIFLEEEGYDEFLFQANTIEIENENNSLIIIADFIHLIIEINNNKYTLSIE